MMFTTTSKKACVAATLTAVAGISMDCQGLQCGVARQNPDDADAPPVPFPYSAHNGLVYISDLTGLLASKLGGLLMITSGPPVEPGPVENDLDAASDVNGDGVVDEDEAEIANEIIAAHEEQQAAVTEEVVFGAGVGDDAPPPVPADDAPDDLVAVQVPSGASIGTEGESSDDAGSGETETTEGGTKKPKRFRPKKLMKKLSAAVMGSSGRDTGAATESEAGNRDGGAGTERTA